MSQVFRWLALSILFCGLIASSVRAADSDREKAKPAPPLPTDRNLWLNTSPYTWEQLRGKGVYLLFFECDPESTDLFPKHLAAAKQHALDPVVFIGVAMSSTRENAEIYLRSTKYNWPTLCDPVYSYTHQCDAALGLPNDDLLAECLTGVAYVTTGGKIVNGWFDNPEMTVKQTLVDASWTTDLKEIPEPLWPIWRAVEFRKYGEAQPLFKKLLNAGSNDQKAVARKLQEVVLSEIERRADEARTAEQADEKWAAYSKIGRILDEFRGYDVPKDLEPLQKKLSRSTPVKAGIVAEKQLTIVTPNLTSPKPPIRKKAQLQLEKIVADFPGTDLAERAQRLLDTPPAAPK